MVLFKIPDIRLFWSTDERFLSQFQQGGYTTVFEPFSVYSPCYKDVSFWIHDNNDSDDRTQEKQQFHENHLCELVREVAGDMVETVSLLDSFSHPTRGQKSVTYRITYRHMSRNVTNAEIDVLQMSIRKSLEQQLAIELR